MFLGLSACHISHRRCTPPPVVSWTTRGIQAHMLISVHPIERPHLSICELEIKHLDIGEDPLLGIGFRQGDEPSARSATALRDPGNPIEKPPTLFADSSGSIPAPRSFLCLVRSSARSDRKTSSPGRAGSTPRVQYRAPGSRPRSLVAEDVSMVLTTRVLRDRPGTTDVTAQQQVIRKELPYNRSLAQV